MEQSEALGTELASKIEEEQVEDQNVEQAMDVVVEPAKENSVDSAKRTSPLTLNYQEVMV